MINSDELCLLHKSAGIAFINIGATILVTSLLSPPGHNHRLWMAIASRHATGSRPKRLLYLLSFNFQLFED